MTDNEITKALDILEKLDFFGGQRAGRELWGEKPADIQNKDIESFSNDVAFLKDFINRLQSQNEALIAGQETLQKALAEKTAEYEALKADEEREHQYCKNVCEPKYKVEIERLQLENSCFADIGKMHSEIRAEAIKEFAERLKSCAHEISCNVLLVVTKHDIDNLVKEMVGEG